jgi:hypothetical protein
MYGYHNISRHENNYSVLCKTEFWTGSFEEHVIHGVQKLKDMLSKLENQKRDDVLSDIK